VCVRWSNMVGAWDSDNKSMSSQVFTFLLITSQRINGWLCYCSSCDNKGDPVYYIVVQHHVKVLKIIPF
jgi:hypothetical protein